MVRSDDYSSAAVNLLRPRLNYKLDMDYIILLMMHISYVQILQIYVCVLYINCSIEFSSIYIMFLS